MNFMNTSKQSSSHCCLFHDHVSHSCLSAATYKTRKRSCARVTHVSSDVVSYLTLSYLNELDVIFQFQSTAHSFVKME